MNLKQAVAMWRRRFRDQHLVTTLPVGESSPDMAQGPYLPFLQVSFRSRSLCGCVLASFGDRGVLGRRRFIKIGDTVSAWPGGNGLANRNESFGFPPRPVDRAMLRRARQPTLSRGYSELPTILEGKAETPVSAISASSWVVSSILDQGSIHVCPPLPKAVSQRSKDRGKSVTRTAQ